ncbi:MAG: dienelactone hydrolase family protein [Oxalobacteraceae bacterium]|nr:MAG: dienelactone hydrolase family protein [Oxalobacteraceae bacterium]
MGYRSSVSIEDGDVGIYLSRPLGIAIGTVVVLHEIFGVNADMRATCDELSADGFLAIAPDMFWRQESGVNLSAWSEAEWQKGLALYAAYDRDIGTRDILEIVEQVRKIAGSSDKVAVLGFCLSGLMAYLASARGPVDAAIAYHGGDTEKYLAYADSISAPLLLHLAEEDEFIPKNAQASIKAALNHKSNIRIHSYPGCNHAFARHTGAHYDATAATLAYNRTRDFLKISLAV